MMKMKIAVLMLVMMVGIAQANLLPNPGFEDGVFSTDPGTLPDEWDSGVDKGGVVADYVTWVNDAPGAHSGSKYMQVTTTDRKEPWINPIDLMPVTGGIEYDFSVWAKSLVAATPPTRTETLIIWFKADQSTMLWTESPKWQLSAADVQWPTTWTKWDIGSFTAPAEAAFVYQEFICWEGNESGTGLCYDDASIVPEPMTLCLLGLGGLMLRRRRKA